MIRGVTAFTVNGEGGYRDLGMTELFFEGAEPSLFEFPLDELLAKFPEGKYKFDGVTVDGARLLSRATLSHNVPAGPAVSSQVNGNSVVISWDPVTGPAAVLPNGQIQIAGYQVIVGSFQVTLPASATSVTVPEAYVASLPRDGHPFEVLAIDVSGNQTITESFYTKS